MATVRYLVNDVDASLAFYFAIGFVESDRWGPPFAILTLGDVNLWLSGPGTSASKALADGSIPTPGGWNRLVIEVGDIHNVLKALREAGAKIRNEPIKGPGGQQALVEDPSGNLVEIFQANSE